MIYVFLTVATVTAFWQVTGHDFINFDDPLYVTENIHIRHGVTAEAIRWAFTTGHAGFWHPLTWVSLMLDCSTLRVEPAWISSDQPFISYRKYACYSFSSLNRMTKAPWKSAFVAALFALHPLHVESVAWVSERKDVLSTFFWMLTMGAYISLCRAPTVYEPICLFLYSLL